MKYKAGDKVKIKSLDWYNENINNDNNVLFTDGFYFSEPMSIFCGKDMVIERCSYLISPPHYFMKDNLFAWTDEMIDGLVEEDIKVSDVILTENIIDFERGKEDKIELRLGNYEITQEGEKWFAVKKKT